MSQPRSVLVLYSSPEPDVRLCAVRDAMVQLGATVVTQRLDADYEKLLDHIERSDTVIYWRR